MPESPASLAATQSPYFASTPSCYKDGAAPSSPTWTAVAAAESPPTIEDGYHYEDDADEVWQQILETEGD